MVARHGTYARYVSKTKPCRCGKCRAANTRYHRAWLRKERARSRLRPIGGESEDSHGGAETGQGESRTYLR
jgi:hypothetical protein